MIIKVFLSSSLKLKDERNAFYEAFKAAENDDVQFELYEHEKNGVMRIISGGDSQEAINAAAHDYDAFITYAGDRIGNATIAELLNELKSAKSLFRFIYVLHQPGLLNDAMKGPGYTDWGEFYELHMHDGVIKYYETELDKLSESADEQEKREECLHNIRIKTEAIARELKSKTIRELFPGMLSYSKVISSGQSNYRKALDVYFHRDVDDRIREALTAEKPAALTLVCGTSLAGKTRAVTEALKVMPSDTHIHILQFDERAADTLAGINPELQFGSSFNNILFVDDLHSLFDTDSNAPHLFMKLCRFAHENTGRLHIIATTILSADDTLEPLRSLATADPWLRNCAVVEIGAMKRSEAMMMLRQLRRKGKLDNNGIIKTGITDIPLGALFIDLDRMHNLYGNALRRDYRLCLVFDAVKTLWIWKVNSRGDITQLLSFINLAYSDILDETITRRDIIELLRLIPEFVMLTGGFKPHMVIEDIIVNEVFRFEVSENAANAITRIVDFIAAHNHPLKDFTKLADRLERSGHYDVADKVVDNACEIYPLDGLRNMSETEASQGESPIDWGASWRAAVARSLIRRNDHVSPRKMLPEDIKSARHSDFLVLATIINDERNRNNISDTLLSVLGPDGLPLPEFLEQPTINLLTEFINNLPFEGALRCFAATDFYHMAMNKAPEGSEVAFIKQKTMKFICTALNSLFARVRTSEDVVIAIHDLESMNSRMPRPIFENKAEVYFRFIYSDTWREISRMLPADNVRVLFNNILEIQIPDKHPEKTVLTTNKAVALNALLYSMEEYDAREAWGAMGNLRDNYTMTALLRRLPDFAAAKGFVDEYLSSESGRDATVNLTMMNALLDRCSTGSDIRECQDLYIKYGLLGEGQTLEDINDEYILGILIRAQGQNYHNILSLLERHKNNSHPRDIRTLGKIIDYVPDFATAYRIMYDPGIAAITDEEREIMQASPLLISWMISKAQSSEEKSESWSIVNNILKREIDGEYLEPMFCHPDLNLVSSILKSRVLCPATSDAIIFYKKVKECLPSLPSNPLPLCNIVERQLEDEKPNPTEKTLDYLNRLIIEYRHGAIEAVRRLVKDRFYCFTQISRKLTIVKQEGIYPMVDAFGRLTLRQTDNIDFAMNMLRHGMLHPFMLSDLIKYYINNHPNPDAKLNQVIEYAKIWKIFVDHKSYIIIRDLILSRGLKTDLLPLAHEYSIIKELTLRLHDNHPASKPISVNQAFAMIRDYEQRTGCHIHLSQRFMDAVVKALTKQPKTYFDKVLESISGILPDYFKFTDQVIYFLAHLVRDPDQFIRLRHLMKPEPLKANFYEALTSAMSKSSEANRHDIAEIIIKELEKSLAATIKVSSSYVLVILNYTRRYNLYQALDYLKEHDVEIKGDNFDMNNLIQYVRTEKDFYHVMSFFGQDLQPKTKTSILTGMVFAMYDMASRTVRADVLDIFNTTSTVEKWHELAYNDNKGLLLKAVRKIYQEIQDPEAPEAQDFFDFWEDVGGFRI